MRTIGNIYLTWRKSSGERRIPIGIIRKNKTEGVRFEYISSGVKLARENGFLSYEGFPDVSKSYSENVIGILGQRLMRSARNDIKDFYDFWKIDRNFVDDDFYMLGYTQGILPTDNFEFLADFYPVQNLSFVTEISGLSKTKIPGDKVLVGDKLRYVIERENEFDEDAVKLYKDDLFLGYVKIIHNRVFHKASRFNVSVHHIEKNGLLKRVFLKVEIK